MIAEDSPIVSEKSRSTSPSRYAWETTTCTARGVGGARKRGVMTSPPSDGGLGGSIIKLLIFIEKADFSISNVPFLGLVVHFGMDTSRKR